MPSTTERTSHPIAIECFAIALVLVAAVACVSRPSGLGGAPGERAAKNCGTGVELLGFVDALDKTVFAETTVGGLSALTYNRGRNVYYALVDHYRDTPARFYTLSLPLPDEGIGELRLLEVTVLRDADGLAFTGANFDGEGIAISSQEEVIVASETEPSLRRFLLDGRLIGELPVPERFRVAPLGQAQGNQTFEGLALSADGKTLFVAAEGSLSPDGQTADGRSRIRILRYEQRAPSEWGPLSQSYYLTDPGLGVADVAASSQDGLVVLERGFSAGHGNTVRVYTTSLRGARDVSGIESLATEPSLVPLEKVLLLDVAACPAGAARNPSAQRNPLLDNFEGLALGPTLADGRQTLVLLSDDNFNPGQVTRLVVLAVSLSGLRR